VTEEPLSLASLFGQGAVAALLLVIGLGAGWLVDQLLHTLPIFVFVGLAFGIAGAARYTYAQMRKYSK
jgi:F0F1-type ATP synthase assembly protein I